MRTLPSRRAGLSWAIAVLLVLPAAAFGTSPGALESEYRNLVDAARPSIVTVIARRPSTAGAGAVSAHGRVHVGSGVVYDADAHVVTTASVADVDDNITVETARGLRFPAHLISRDPTANIAILEVGTHALPALPLGRSSALAPGALVVLVGYSSGSRDASSALGTVSEPYAVSGLREGGSVLTVNAAVRPGWSGGAVLNTSGELIGLVAGRIDGSNAASSRAAMAPEPGDAGVESNGGAGATVVVPVEQLQQAVAQILVPESGARGFLGVRVVGLTPYLRTRLGAGQGTGGVVVYEVLPGAPAERAGLRSGDVIVTIDSAPVEDVADLTRRVGSMAPKTRVNLGYIRDGMPLRATAEVAEMPSALRELQAASSDSTRASDRRKYLQEEIRRLEAELERYRQELSALER